MARVCGLATPAAVVMLASLRAGARLQAVPPGTDARHHLVIAGNHLHGTSEAVSGVLEPQRTRFGAVFGRQPGAVVAPHARAFLALRRLPSRGIDRARAP